MTIDELKQALNQIPPNSQENLARRAAIMKRIRELERKEKAGK